MQYKDNISMSVIRRLPRYYRFLKELNQSGITRTSSKELSNRMGFTASQIRQDFNCFGGFGQQGYGYNVPQLCIEIEKILGLGNHHQCILLGAGNLGRTIAAHVPFQNLGFELAAIFDRNPQLWNSYIGGLKIRDSHTLPDFVKSEKPIMAVLCLPRNSVEEEVAALYDLGIKSYWNFSHYDIAMAYPDAIVENVHLNDSLMTLCYSLSSKTKEDI